MRFPALLTLFASALFLSGCVHNYYVKENLSPGQVVETAIVRKPSLVKSRIILPRYDDYLDGYLRGRLLTFDGKPLQGIVVKVTDKKGKDYSGFTPGVSDSSGIYKVRFSQPIIWKRVDIDASLSFESGWTAVGKKTKFRFYFNRRSGDLVFTPEDNIMVLENKDELKKKIMEAPAKKPAAPSAFDMPGMGPEPGASGSAPPGGKPAKSDDPFGDFDL